MAIVNVLDFIEWGVLGFWCALVLFTVLVGVPVILWLRYRKAYVRKRMAERLKEVCK